MKVAHICLYPPKDAKHINVSGVASYTKNLLTHIPPQHAEQHIICDKLSGTRKHYTDSSFHVARTFDRNLGFAASIHRQLKHIKPDVIHLQHELALFGNILTAYLVPCLVAAWRRKMVVTLHGVVGLSDVDARFIQANNYGRAPVWAVRLGLRLLYGPLGYFAAHIIVHEPYFKLILAKDYHVPVGKISVIPHGVEDLTAINKQQARKSLDIPEDKKVVLFMGYAAGYKGIDLLLEGFAKYASSNPDALLIVGAGMHPKLKDNAKYKASYDQLMYKAALLIDPKQYRWVGFIDETQIDTYYSAADVSVYPYQIAMASSGPMSFAIGLGRPFLASSAFSDVFAQEFIFDRTPEAMAAKLTDFFADTSQLKTAVLTMRGDRQWKRVGAKTLQVYAAVGGANAQ